MTLHRSMRIHEDARPPRQRSLRTSGVTTLACATVALCVPVACGDVYADPVGSAVRPDVAPSTPAFAGSAIPTIPCPDREPLEGAACGGQTPGPVAPTTVVGMTCEYGRSAALGCNKVYACVGGPLRGEWRVRPFDLCPTFACPTGSMDKIEGTPCSVPSADGGVGDAGATNEADELVCTMDRGACACTTGVDGAHAHERKWVCVRPPPTCPTERPRAGQPCTSELRTCDYGSCSFKQGVRMECDGRVWLTQGGSCP